MRDNRHFHQNTNRTASTGQDIAHCSEAKDSYENMHLFVSLGNTHWIVILWNKSVSWHGLTSTCIPLVAMSCIKSLRATYGWMGLCVRTDKKKRLFVPKSVLWSHSLKTLRLFLGWLVRYCENSQCCDPRCFQERHAAAKTQTSTLVTIHGWPSLCSSVSAQEGKLWDADVCIKKDLFHSAWHCTGFGRVSQIR